MNRVLRTKYHKYLPCKGQGWPIWWHLLLVACFLESWWWCTYTADTWYHLIFWNMFCPSDFVPLIHSTGGTSLNLRQRHTWKSCTQLARFQLGNNAQVMQTHLRLACLWIIDISVRVACFFFWVSTVGNFGGRSTAWMKQVEIFGNNSLQEINHLFLGQWMAMGQWECSSGVGEKFHVGLEWRWLPSSGNKTSR